MQAHPHWLQGLVAPLWVLSGIGSLLVCQAVLRRLAAHAFAIVQRAWPQALWTPAVTALSLLNLTMSLTTRTIRWRGITYTMLSPQRVMVHRVTPSPAERGNDTPRARDGVASRRERVRVRKESHGGRRGSRTLPS